MTFASGAPVEASVTWPVMIPETVIIMFMLGVVEPAVTGTLSTSVVT